jgi:predicted MFS family arabinose efflux permease
MTENDSPAQEERAGISGWVVVALIALSATVGHAFGRFSYGVLLPAVRDDLAISNTLAGFIGGTNVGFYLVGTLLVSWMAGRYRLLGIMRLGLVLAVCGLFAAGFSTSPWTLALALAITGVGGALLWIPAPVIAADAIPSNRRPLAVGLMGSGIGLGVMLVSTISGDLRASLGDGAWSNVYQLQFAVAVVVLVLVLLLVRHQQGAPSGGGGVGGFAALQRMPGWLPLIAAYACFGFMYLLVLGFLTTRLEDDSGWSSADASFAYSLMGFSMLFGSPMFTLLAQRFGLRLVISAAFGLWPIFTAIVLTGAWMPVLFAAVGIGFLFSALPSLITLYVVENTTAADYGASFSAATLMFGLAQTVSPPIGGLIADLCGSFTLVFFLSSIVSVMGLLATLRLPKIASG